MTEKRQATCGDLSIRVCVCKCVCFWSGINEAGWDVSMGRCGWPIGVGLLVYRESGFIAVQNPLSWRKQLGRNWEICVAVFVFYNVHPSTVPRIPLLGGWRNDSDLALNHQIAIDFPSPLLSLLMECRMSWYAHFTPKCWHKYTPTLYHQWLNLCFSLMYFAFLHALNLKFLLCMFPIHNSSAILNV